MHWNLDISAISQSSSCRRIETLSATLRTTHIDIFPFPIFFYCFEKRHTIHDHVGSFLNLKHLRFHVCLSLSAIGHSNGYSATYHSATVCHRIAIRQISANLPNGNSVTNSHGIAIRSITLFLQNGNSVTNSLQMIWPITLKRKRNLSFQNARSFRLSSNEPKTNRRFLNTRSSILFGCTWRPNKITVVNPIQLWRLYRLGMGGSAKL